MVASGDERALCLLYDAQADWAYSVALKVLRDEQAAEDAVQEAFVKLWRSAARFDSALGSARSWIGIIVRNVALDMRRRSKPTDELDDRVMANWATEAIEPPDPKLGKCLDQLPREHARAIVTMYTYGLSHTELSEHLDLPLGTVKSWVRRGTKSLKVCMER
jgi:RNA polymerase sigma-70 factor (ECF subfamily)